MDGWMDGRMDGKMDGWMDGKIWDHGGGSTVRDRRQHLTSDDETSLHHDKVEKTPDASLYIFLIVVFSPMSTNPFTPSNAPAFASPMPNSFVT
jgi:hypothetical protein